MFRLKSFDDTQISAIALPGFSASWSVIAGLLLVAAVTTGCAGLREARRAESVGVRWVIIPGGSFRMGDTFRESNPDAIPVHEAVLAPFRIAVTETTVGQYRGFVSATGRAWVDPGTAALDEMAVSDVDWDDAVAFCTWIGGRLPSEQEWEFAAAGGPDKQLFAGTNLVDSLSAYARYRGNSVAQAGPVAHKLPNRFGLFDMSGNVAEWIGAYYQFYPKPGEAPVYSDETSSGIRIIRGGSFSMEPEIASTFWRAGTLREVTSPAIGFRCVKDL